MDNPVFDVVDRETCEQIVHGEIDLVYTSFYELLYDFYLNSGEMPIGIAKARDGDPDRWICERLAEALGVSGVKFL